jgi:O-antigen/teichoic acid export membrane protein
LRFEPKEWISIAKESFPLGIGNVMGSLTVNLAPIVIGILLSNTDVGIFSAASKMVFFLLMFDRVFAQLLLPAATRFHSDSMEVMSSRLASAAKWVIVRITGLSWRHNAGI